MTAIDALTVILLTLLCLVGMTAVAVFALALCAAASKGDEQLRIDE